MDVVGHIIAFFGDQTRQGAIALAGAAMAATAAGSWKIYTHFSKTRDFARDSIGGKGEIRLSIEEYDRRLNLRALEVEQQILSSHGNERERLKKELVELNEKLDNISLSYADATSKIANLEDEISSIGPNEYSELFTRSTDAFKAGDLDKSRRHLEDIISAQVKNMEIVSKANFGLGVIAEENVEWDKAAEHFVKSYNYNETEQSLYKSSVYLWRSGSFEQAVSATSRLLDLTIEKYGEDHYDTIAITNNLAAQLYDWGKREAALELFNKTLAARRKIGDTSSREYARLLANIANIHLVDGDIDTAIELQTQSREILREIDISDEGYSTVTNALGESYRLKRDYEKAAFFMEDALQSDIKTFGPDHPMIARDLNFLGKLKGNIGQWGKAAECFRRSFAIQKASVGINHPNTLAIVGNLVICLRKVGHDSAQELQELTQIFPFIEDMPDFDID